MKNLEKLAKNLLYGKEITLDYEEYNDGTEKNPDIIIYRVSAVIEKEIGLDHKNIVAYLSYENNKSVFDSVEIYKTPLITDLKILMPLLEEIKNQAHSP